jgi:hypothetical protein
MTEVHVVADERNTGRVVEGDESGLLFEHVTATEDEVAAREHANDKNADRAIDDRYHRAHDVTPLPARRSARERHARARRLALVRERARQLARGRTR